jgi:hypothetical protein
VETIRSNVIGCLNLADTCHSLGIHMTYYGTGCIFHYDDDFPMNSGKGFKESDKPNFTGSYYSYTKASCSCRSSCSCCHGWHDHSSVSTSQGYRVFAWCTGSMVLSCQPVICSSSTISQAATQHFSYRHLLLPNERLISNDYPYKYA